MPNLNKKQILERIITIPDRGRRDFWKREYKLLNDLMAIYPDIDFWEKVRFHQEWDSIKILKSEYGKNLLEKKYREFHYIVPIKEQYILGGKCGSDKEINKNPKTIQEFLL